ncbi:Uncharacterised protein [Mycobacteroides abscessus subsp. abscessus]|nr:Uncharacterised protein [Mycobacteroides abscessus subsp. abscessus]
MSSMPGAVTTRRPYRSASLGAIREMTTMGTMSGVSATAD